MEKRKPAPPVAQSGVINEGGAKIWQQESVKDGSIKQEAFYNKVQVYNRDLTLLCMTTHALWLKEKKEHKFKKLRYYDAFTASGLRALRAHFEMSPELLDGVTGCDISEDAIKNFKNNLQLNNLSEDAITVIHDDTIKHMSTRHYPHFYDLIDLDPYGSAVPFLSSAFQAVNDGSLMAITCTDMRVLAGSDLHKCFYLYGAIRSRIPCFEEHAARLAMATISRIANEHKKAIEPLLSIQKDFYLRVFVRVTNQKSECWKSMARTGTIYYCVQCSNAHVERFGHYDPERKNYVPNRLTLPSVKCNLCGGNWVPNGPVWLDPLNNTDFVKRLIKGFDALTDETHPLRPYYQGLKVTKNEEIEGLFKAIEHEIPLADNPLTWDLTSFFGFVKTGAPKNLWIHAAFHNAGFKYCQSYQNPKGIKTNAPNSFIFDLVQAWRKVWADKHEVPYLDKVEPESVGMKILEKTPEHKISFDVVKEVLDDEKNKPSNYFPNPEPNWGPKKAAAIKITREENPSNKEEAEEAVEEKATPA